MLQDEMFAATVPSESAAYLKFESSAFTGVFILSLGLFCKLIPVPLEVCAPLCEGRCFLIVSGLHDSDAIKGIHDTGTDKVANSWQLSLQAQAQTHAASGNGDGNTAYTCNSSGPALPMLNAGSLTPIPVRAAITLCAQYLCTVLRHVH